MAYALYNKTLHGSSHNVSSAFSASWDSSGRYLAVGESGGDELKVFSFDGTVLTELSGCSKDFGNWVRAVDWTPDGKYIAAAGVGADLGEGTRNVRVYPAVFSDENAKFPMEDGTLKLGGVELSVNNLNMIAN